MEQKKTLTSRGADFYIYQLACQFHDVVESLTPSQLGSAPFIVNLSFSVELFIKSMDVTHEIIYDSKENVITEPTRKVHGRVGGKNSHSLKQMFLGVSGNRRSNAIKYYEQKHKRDLLDDLESVELAFVDYRYIFEKDEMKIELSTLIRLAVFFRDYIFNVIGFTLTQSS